MSTLKSKIAKLALEHPEMRGDLVPLLGSGGVPQASKQAASGKALVKEVTGRVSGVDQLALKGVRYDKGSRSLVVDITGKVTVPIDESVLSALPAPVVKEVISQGGAPMIEQLPAAAFEDLPVAILTAVPVSLLVKKGVSNEVLIAALEGKSFESLDSEYDWPWDGSSDWLEDWAVKGAKKAIESASVTLVGWGGNWVTVKMSVSRGVLTWSGDSPMEYGPGKITRAALDHSCSMVGVLKRGLDPKVKAKLEAEKGRYDMEDVGDEYELSGDVTATMVGLNSTGGQIFTDYETKVPLTKAPRDFLIALLERLK
jgi:hypothetical protein